MAIVEDQPSPELFFKTFLELDGSNMVSQLSFDSRSLSHLLDESKFKSYFNSKYPIFYKNKFTSLKG